MVTKGGDAADKGDKKKKRKTKRKYNTNRAKEEAPPRTRRRIVRDIAIEQILTENKDLVVQVVQRVEHAPQTNGTPKSQISFSKKLVRAARM